MDLAHAFKSEVFADAELKLLCWDRHRWSSSPSDGVHLDGSYPTKPSESVEGPSGAAQLQVIDSFPAHRLALGRSEYFNAQILRWQTEECIDAASGRKRDRSSRDVRPELHLTLNSADQQAAAEAVIATLYFTNQPLLALSTERLVQAIMLADRLQLAATVQFAVDELKRKVNSLQPMPQGIAEMFSNLPVWPRCLASVVPAVARAWPKDSTDSHLAKTLKQMLQHILLAVFGRLNEVWADKQLHELLMKLPLSAMQLLLSADELVVDSEDTVLYTAAQYVTAQKPGREWGAAKAAAAAKLASSIRCSWLSTCCLAAAALAADEDGSSDDDSSYSKEGPNGVLLYYHRRELRRLLSLRLLSQRDITRRVQKEIPSAPGSWLLPVRAHQEIPTTSVTWKLKVDDLQRACHRCCTNRAKQILRGPTSPPKAGMGWHTQIRCNPGSAAADGVPSCMLGLYVGPVDAPRHMFFAYSYTVEVWSAGCERRCLKAASDVSQDVRGHQEWGWDDFFGVGKMCGGLDMPVWVQAGWPESGELEIKLVVSHIVGEEAPPRAEDNTTEAESSAESGASSE